MKAIPYNTNITLIREVKKSVGKLLDNQYYALMICDSPCPKDSRKFFNKTKNWLGLERTTPNEIYISKKFYNRHSPLRGITFLVRVYNPAVCYGLTL